MARKPKKYLVTVERWTTHEVEVNATNCAQAREFAAGLAGGNRWNLFKMLPGGWEITEATRLSEGARQ